MSNGLNLLYPWKDAAEMVIIFLVPHRSGGFGVSGHEMRMCLQGLRNQENCHCGVIVLVIILRCLSLSIFQACSFCAWYHFGTQLLGFWRLHFVPMLTCWMNGFKLKIWQACVSKSSFLRNPYRSWEFHNSIKYQCPGVTVPNGPNGRRFWRAPTW